MRGTVRNTVICQFDPQPERLDGRPGAPDASRLFASRAPGEIHEHVRQPASGGLQGVQWRALLQTPVQIERRSKRVLRRRTHFALVERHYDARTSVHCVRSDLSLLFAANPREGLAEVGVDALRVAKRRIEDRFHKVSCSRFVRYTHSSSAPACKSCSRLHSPRSFRGLRASVMCQHSATVKWIDTFTHRITQTNCAPLSGWLLCGFDVTTNGRRQEIIVWYLLHN